MDWGFTANIVSAAAALIAATFWFVSAVIKVPLKEGGTDNPEIEVDGYAFISTTKAQITWSRRAALFAALAALAQAVAILLVS